MKETLKNVTNALMNLWLLHAVLFLAAVIFALAIHGGRAIVPPWIIVELFIFLFHSFIILILAILDCII